jgi:hypothetical protein
MLVDPLTPTAKILRSTLVCDLLECPDRDFVVHRDCDVPNFARVLVDIPELKVTPLPVGRTIAHVGEDRRDFFAGENSPNHRKSLVEPGCVGDLRFLGHRLGIDAPLFEILVGDFPTFTLMECDRLVEILEGLHSGGTLAGNTRFNMDRCPHFLVVKPCQPDLLSCHRVE